MINALTIDVEDYYSVFARDWLDITMAVSEAVLRNTDWLLSSLADHGVKATFFVLGEVAQAFPQLVRLISEADHELGVHGFYHQQVFKLTREQFAIEVEDAKKCIEDIIQMPVKGHRAPAFSITLQTAWALEVLAELGFQYDSSIFSFGGRRYGWPGFGSTIRPIKLPNGMSIIEAPLSTVRVLGRCFPVGGGGYLRHFPYLVTQWAIRRIQKAQPVVVYLHPYEVDTEPAPAVFQRALSKAERQVKIFHTLQLCRRKTVKHQIHRLLSDFKFAPLGEVVRNLSV